MMNRLKMLMSAVTVFMVLSGFGGTMAINTWNNYTLGDFKLRSGEGVTISPTSGYASTSPGSMNVFTVKLPVGIKFQYWMCLYVENWMAHRWSEDDFFSTDNPVTVPYVEGINNAHLIAHLDYISYSLKFDTLGGTHSPTNETLTLLYTNEVKFAAYNGTKTGYVFESWTNSANAAMEPLTGDFTVTGERLGVTNDNEQVTLAAKWRTATYRIEYDLVGGEFGELHPESAEYDSEFGVSEPTKRGYDFKEWTVSGESLEEFEKPRTEGGVTYFKNLTAVDGGQVKLTAVWENRKIKVSFDGDGASSCPAQAEVVFDKPYEAVSVPVKSGFTFKGFYDDPSWANQYWDANGQPSKEIWDIPTNVTVCAKWEALSVRYFVAFNGHGATSGTMEAQEFRLGEEQSLAKNSYKKKGYSFLGWAKDEEAADSLKWTYQDGQPVKNLCDEPDTTNELWAVWGTNSYAVAYDPNGGSGTMPVQDFIYDQTQELYVCTFDAPSAIYQFDSWRDLNGVKYSAGQCVTNDLWLGANVTNVLSAVWKLSVGSWSEAMHCTSLIWGIANTNFDYYVSWRQYSGAEFGYNGSGSCVGQDGAPGEGYAGTKTWLSVLAPTNGTLSFYCKWSAAPRDELSSLDVGFSSSDELFAGKSSPYILISASDWVKVEIPVKLLPDEEKTYVHLASYGDEGNILYIDQMTWIPEGGEPVHPEPQPGKDEATVTRAGFSDDGLTFSLTFGSDERFDYNLLTNGNLSAGGWGVKETWSGDGKLHSFMPAVEPDCGKLFYRVQTIQRKSSK